MSKIYLALLCSISMLSMAGFSFGQQGHPGDWSGHEASWLIGHLVKSPEGSSLGQISDLVIDEANHKIALVLLSDVPGAGDRLMAIPYGALLRTGESLFEIRFGDAATEIGPTSGYGDTYVRLMEALPGDLFRVPTVIEPSWVDFVHLSYGEKPYSTAMEPTTEPAAEDFSRWSAMNGARVEVFETGARVDDLIINLSDGRIAFISISGIPERKVVAVPFSFLTRTADNRLALNLMEDELEEAPSYESGRDFKGRTWAEGVYRFFGVQPYWSE
jgi:hypothetical protein